MELARDIISILLFAGGGFFVLIGAIGVLRFPDFYTRLHAAGITDTLGAELIIIGMAVQTDQWTVLAKLFFIALFMLLTSPVATHAIAHAAWVGGLNPRLGKDLKFANISANIDNRTPEEGGHG